MRVNHHRPTGCTRQGTDCPLPIWASTPSTSLHIDGSSLASVVATLPSACNDANKQIHHLDSILFDLLHACVCPWLAVRVSVGGSAKGAPSGNYYLKSKTFLQPPFGPVCGTRHHSVSKHQWKQNAPQSTFVFTSNWEAALLITDC